MTATSTMNVGATNDFCAAPPRLDSSNRPRPMRRTDVVVHELDGEALLFDPVSMNTHRLNETGLIIWHMCDGGTDSAAIVERLAELYDVSPDMAAGHVDHLLKELEQQSLIQMVNTHRVWTRAIYRFRECHPVA